MKNELKIENCKETIRNLKNEIGKCDDKKIKSHLQNRIAEEEAILKKLSSPICNYDLAKLPKGAMILYISFGDGKGQSQIGTGIYNGLSPNDDGDMIYHHITFYEGDCQIPVDDTDEFFIGIESNETIIIIAIDGDGNPIIHPCHNES